MKRIIRNIVLICLAGVIAFCAYQIYSLSSEYKEGRDQYDDIKDTVTTETNEPDEETETDPNIPPIEVDFEELKAVNEDVVGWIYIGSVDISYPIVQGEDNDYYLHHTYNKIPLFSASIFMDYQNMAGFSDSNTVLYGHNMKDGSMFGKLKKILSEKLYEDDPNIWIFTPDNTYRYEIFNLYTSNPTGETYHVFRNMPEEFASWANEIKLQSNITDYVFTGDEKVLTLSTCTSDGSNRTIVQARRIYAANEETDTQEETTEFYAQ